MTIEASRAQLADLMDVVRSGMKSIAQAQRRQAELTATASAAGRRVTVVVNANCVVIETRFSDDIDDLSYAEIAAAVTAATQRAADEIQRRTGELMGSLKTEQARMPRLSEFVAGIPDVAEMLPTPPPVSTAPPNARRKIAAETDEPADGAMEFANVEQWNHGTAPQERSGVHDSSW